MNTTYSSIYPCKVISNFCYIYYKDQKYKTCKQITLRKISPKTDEEKEILDFFKYFQLIYSLDLNSLVAEYKKFFIFVFKRSVSKKLATLIDNFQLKNDFTWINKALDNLLTFSNSEAFVIYNFILINLSFIFGYPCRLPLNIIETDNTIENQSVRHYFNIGYLTSLLKKDFIDLKKELIEYLESIKDDLKGKGVEELYLFGSINDNEYHDASDIDLIIQYKENINFDEIIGIEKELRNMLLNKFYRKSDIQNFTHYVLIGNIKKTTRIF
ncbi:MAG: nucleotidyltransferase family protein [Bacillales bacterium]